VSADTSLARLFPDEAVVQVSLPLPPRQTFSYRVPVDFPFPVPGCRVRVSFGRQRLIGYVVKDAFAVPPESLKPIEEVIDIKPILSEEVLDLTRWIADYYLVSWGSVIRCAYPSGLDPSPRSRFGLLKKEDAQAPIQLVPVLDSLAAGPRTLSFLRGTLGPPAEDLLRQAVQDGWVVEETAWKAKRCHLGQDRVALLKPHEEAQALASDPGTPTFFRKALTALLPFQARGFPTVAEVAKAAKVPQYVLSEMADACLVELFDLLPAKLEGRPSPHELSAAQAEAVAAVLASMELGQHKTFLLFGVTGSGKTEVYMRLMERAIRTGGSALYLVPEISMASFLARRLLERFGSDVAILHSSMTEHERVRQWLRASSGGARAVIGPRSALFAPLPNLKLIVVDEEHDGSYKQQDFPRYHARDMAVLRGQKAGIPVVLGSATPSVESYYNASETGKYELLTLPERTRSATLPPVEVVDMRQEYRERGGQFTLSRALETELSGALAEGHQAVLLRNRLGYSTFILCRQCGRTVQCPDCSVAFTYHRRAERLKCHYCGKQAPVPLDCPSCGGEVLQFLGEGTEKVEEVLERAYPGTRVARMDRDAVHSGRDFDALWKDFEAGAIGILAGTQMVAKGHDVPNVTLVGILSADFLLGMPDFRAAERTFQLITQAEGRAGRGEHPGRVILQSYHPDHYAVQAAKEHDFVAFYEKDIRYRKMVGYPPASALARLEFRHRDKEKGEALAGEAAKLIRDAGDFQLRVLGPVEAPLSRLEGQFRVHILLRADSRARLRAVLAKVLESPLGRHNGREMLLEIDPYSLM